MSSSGEGLRVGTDGAVHILVLDGYEPRDLSDYTVTATAKYRDSVAPAFPVSMSAVNLVTPGVDGHYIAGFDGGDLTEAGRVALELTFAGSPTLNANASPVLIPVRAIYEDAE